MSHRRYPSYPDDADYNTNAPSYYEDLARKQALIKELAERIWGYEETLNLTLADIAKRFIEIAQRFTEWDLKIAGFDGDLNILLQEWISDGTFDHIINDTIFKWKADQSELAKVMYNPTNYVGGMVTIIDDDARPDFRTVWQPILDANPDVKISIAVVKDWTEDGSALSVTELLALQNEGNDLLCHTTHHEPSYSISPDNAELDYPVAVEWMKANGLKGYEYLVYPGGLAPTAANIKNVARKHFKYAISTETAGDYAISPVDNWCVPRINGDAKTIAELKTAVDYAKANGIWLILMTHSHVLLSAGATKMQEFIDYVELQGVPILNYSEAVKLKGNAIAIGEMSTNNSFFVGNDGRTTGGYTHEVGNTQFNRPLTTYQKATTTVQTINSIQDAYKGVGGVLTTYRMADDSYSYQEFVTVNSIEIFTRKWSSEGWGLFQNPTNLIVETQTTAQMDKPITSYSKHSVTYVEVPYTLDTYLGSGGSLVVYRGADDAYAYQEYVPMLAGTVTTVQKHIRRVNGTGYTPWVQL